MFFWNPWPAKLLGRLQSEKAQRSTAESVGVAMSVILKLHNRFQETGNARRRQSKVAYVLSQLMTVSDINSSRNKTYNATQLQFLLTQDRENKDKQSEIDFISVASICTYDMYSF